MKEIFLMCTSKKAIIDDEDYDRVRKYSWALRGACNGNISRYEHPYIALANFIMQTDKNYDHKDRDPFNNQKSNLREATKSQNMMNRAKYDDWIRGTTSKYKGVSYDSVKLKRKWRAMIYHKVNGKTTRVHLGMFFSEEGAARAYDEAAKRLHGEFAVLNFPQEPT